MFKTYTQSLGLSVRVYGSIEKRKYTRVDAKCEVVSREKIGVRYCCSKEGGDDSYSLDV